MFCVVEKEQFDYAKRNIPYCKYSIEIIYYEQLKEKINGIKSDDGFILLISNNHKLEHCVNVLHKNNITYVYIVDLYAIDKSLPLTNENGEFTQYVKRISLNRPYLVHMETHINNRCNLNCKACNNFAPWVVEDDHDHIKSLISDLSKLSALTTIGRLFLLGGEPLLEAEWVRASVKAVRDILPTSEIRLLTNGLLIPSMADSFWNCIRENDVIIYITLYPPTIKRIIEIKNCLTRNNVKYVLGPQVVTFEKRWTNMPYEDAEYNSSKCGSSGCHYFGNGIYTKCPDAATISYSGLLGKVPTKSIKSIDEIRDGWYLCEELEKPSDMCRYCTIERREQIKWEPCGKKPSIHDWKIENREVYIQRGQEFFINFIREKTNKFIDEYEIGIWGCGTVFNEIYYRIKDYVKVKYLTDNNIDLMNTTCRKLGLSPLNSKCVLEHSNLFYLVAVDNPTALVEICSFLDANNIKHAHIREIMR